MSSPCSIAARGKSKQVQKISNRQRWMKKHACGKVELVTVTDARMQFPSMSICLAWSAPYVLSLLQLVVIVLATSIGLLASANLGWGKTPIHQTGLCIAESKASAESEVGRSDGELTPQTRQLVGEPLFCDGRKLRSCHARRKVRRTKDEIERERQELLQKTIREIDALVAEFHAKLPRDKAESIGSFYARYSSRYQASVVDQVRALFEAAVARGIFVPRENIFFDLATRGFKDRRPGLTALRALLSKKGCEVFMVFATNRLYRRAYKAQEFAEEDLVENGVRGVFLNPLIDTADSNWRLVFQIICSLDEQHVRSIGSFVRSAHEGLFLAGMICTTLPLGYTGEVVPGELTRQKRPRRRVVVDKDTQDWILKIFTWYVEGDVTTGEGPLSLDEIARRLNADPDAPAPAKSLTGLWTHALVRSHLMNPCYRGAWCYGAKETTWLSKKDYALQVPRPEPLKSGQFENLRIVSDELWYGAQELLAKEKADSGRQPKDGDRTFRPRLLRGLFVCPEHDRQLAVGGPQGRILYCPLCRAIAVDSRPLFTHLKRSLALRLLCDKLAALVQADEPLVADIIVQCQRAAESAQKPDPEAVARLRAQADRIGRTIAFNRRNPGDSEAEQQRTQDLIKQLEKEQNKLLSELAVHQAAHTRPILVPTAEEVRGMLDQLSQILLSAASAETAEEMRPVRRIIDDLTGGKIELYQMGERRKGAGWLQGRFRVDLISVVVSQLTGIRVAEDGTGQEVVIDFRPLRLIDEQANEAKQLWEQGLLNKEIARRMGRLPSYVTKLIFHWFDSRGLPRPDNRRRRKELERKQVATPTYQQIADEAVRQMEAGCSNLAIARQLKTADATVAKAIASWFTSRGLPVPTAAGRRRKMLQRAKQMYDGKILIKDIAAQLGYSARGLKLALKEYFAELGQEFPDGRSRRGNAKSGEPAQGHPDGNINDQAGQEAQDEPEDCGPAEDAA